MKRATHLTIAAALVVGGIGLAACTKPNSVQANDRKIANEQLGKYQQSQPAPVFDYSQLRQNLIEIETVQARSTVTHSFFFNQGAADPVFDCPSIGMPIASTAQLTNPQQKLIDHDLALPQIENTGIYTGDSTGTHAICLDAEGRAYDFYWEGFVAATTYAAHWDRTAHTVVLDGAPTAAFTGKKK